MGYLSRRRGVISVFLLIIFMITYVFMGMLVDAGRYRMAQTYMESALDSAGSSVLSSYNKLVFDLYGLFSTDITLAEGETMESKIEALYNSYLQETLGIIDVDTEQYSTLLNNVLHAGEEKSLLTTKSLYDFQITELDAGTSITLANTSNVENQIIEYMKFRAPVELMGEVGEFMEKLNNITQMDDRIAAAQEKREITKKYENDDYSVSEIGNDVLLKMDDFMSRLKSASKAADPHNVVFNFYGAISRYDTVYRNSFSEYREMIIQSKEAYSDIVKSMLCDAQICIIEQGAAWEILVTDFVTGKEVKFSELKNIDEIDTDGTDAEAFFNFSKIMNIAETVFEQIEKWKTEYTNAVEQPQIVKLYDSFDDEYGEEVLDFWNQIDTAETTFNSYKAQALEALQEIGTREKKLAGLWEEAFIGDNSLQAQFKNVCDVYASYIGELEAKKEASDNQEDKASYETDIQQLKSSAAIITEKKQLLEKLEPYLTNVALGSSNSTRLSYVAYNKAEEYRLEAEGNLGKGEAESLCDFFGFDSATVTKIDIPSLQYKEVSAPEPKELLVITQKSLYILFDEAKEYEPAGKPTEENNEVTAATEQKIDTDEVMNDTMSQNDNKEDSNTGEEEQVDLVNESFTADMLKVEYQANTNVGHGFNMDNCSIDSEEELNMGVFDKLLEAASSLISLLGDLLEGARDNLYVDAYIMTTFPNYYTHYQKRSSNKDDELIAGEYAKYNASWAEVEFIITGGNPDKGELYDAEEWSQNASDFGWDSVNAMKSKLFGIRLALNAVSMFTDPGRYSQAMTISSWAGLFAPLVACVLMIAWTVAETALDVLVLTGEDALNLSEDGTVPLYKGSSQWYISMGGVLTALANNAVDVIANAVISEVDVLASSLETELNAMLYDVYVAINDRTVKTVDEVYAMVEGKGNAILNHWSGELKNNMNTAMADSEETIDASKQAVVSGKLEEAEEALNNKFSGVLEDSKQKIQDTVGEVTEAGMEQAKLVIAEMKNQVMDVAEEAINGVADQAKDFISENISKIVPTGTSGTAACPISLGYEDYLYLFLFLMDTETKIQRVQAVIQANMQVGGLSSFKMENAPVAVWADLECSMKYMFMSNGLVPESMKRDGRLRLKVISAQSY